MHSKITPWNKQKIASLGYETISLPSRTAGFTLSLLWNAKQERPLAMKLGKQRVHTMLYCYDDILPPPHKVSNVWSLSCVMVTGVQQALY